MTSILKVDTIQTAAGGTPTLTSLGISAADISVAVFARDDTKTVSSGTWGTREFTTTIYNNISGMSIVSGGIVFPAGIYLVTTTSFCRHESSDVGETQDRLYDTTNSEEIAASVRDFGITSNSVTHITDTVINTNSTVNVVLQTWAENAAWSDFQAFDSTAPTSAPNRNASIKIIKINV